MKNINRVQIYRQYFLLPINLLCMIGVLFSELTALIPLTEGTFSFQKWANDLGEAVLVISVFMFPLAVLALLNRFFFGEVVCTLDEEGIHHQNELIKWDTISRIEYNAVSFGRTHYRPSYIEVTCEKTIVQIQSVPLYMLSVVKKFNPNIKLKTGSIWFIHAMIFLLPIIVLAVKSGDAK